MSIFSDLSKTVYDGIIVLLVGIALIVTVNLFVGGIPNAAAAGIAADTACDDGTEGNCHLCGRDAYVATFTARKPVSVRLCTSCIACLHVKDSLSTEQPSDFEIENTGPFLRDPALYPTEKERVANKLPPLPVAVKAIAKAAVKAPAKVKK